MSLQNRITLLAEAIGDDIQILLAQDGNLSNLNTTDKTSLVNAINEVLTSAAGNTNLAVGSNNSLTLQITSSTGNNVTLNGATALVAGLMLASDKDKLDNITAGATANSSDTFLLDRTNHSGTQLAATISDFNSAVLQAVEGDIAPAALNSLDELAQALGDDPNFAATIATALGNRVRFDAAQSLSTGEQLQACQNIGVGNPETDFLSQYEAARDS